MAERRMFAKNVVDSDLFLEMPTTAQALYFHLGVRADDDGFIDNPRKIQRMIGASADDLKLLVAKQFIIPFESGVVVIRHWRIHNYIRGDRKKMTEYIDEYERLGENKNGTYYLVDGQMSVKCQSTDGQVTDKCQHRLGEGSIGEDSIGEYRGESSNPPTKSTKTVRHKYGQYGNVLLTDEQITKVKEELPDKWEYYIDRIDTYVAMKGKGYANYLAAIRNWAKRDKEQTVTKSKQSLSDIADELSNFFESEVTNG